AAEGERARAPEIHRDARHRRRDPREVPRAGHPRAQPPDPRDPGLRALPAGGPDARARLGPPPGRRLPAQARPVAGGDRGGSRVLRPGRDGGDEVAEAPRDRSSRRLRDALREVPDERSRPRRPGVRRAGRARARDRAAQDRRRDGRGGAARPQRARRAAGGRGGAARGGAADADAVDGRALHPGHRPRARRRSRQARVLGRLPRARRLVRRAAAVL
ncbi:MAG: hypothetical protein AVDCRST_MAG53-2025, partial [uncultured Solirubrobacteraceae bacterium]